MRHFTKEEQKKYTEAVNKMFKPVESKKEKLLAKHILELQADKGRLTDRVRELEEKLANADYQLEGRDNEITELKELLEACKQERIEALYRNEQYIKENAELKEINTHTLSQLNLDNGELITQLTKAKEIIKELVRVEYADFTNGDYSKELSKVLEQAEQFLKSSEV